MLKKQTLKSRPVCKLSFELPKEFEADSLDLLASFNDWEPVPFKKQKNGKWKLTQEVATGETHEFRYRGVNNGDEFYLNDPDADAVTQNDQGSENAVVYT